MSEKEIKENDAQKLSSENAKKIVHDILTEIEHKSKKEIAHKIPIQIKEESKQDLENDIVRLQAEFENYRKRTIKEMEMRAEFGKMEFAKSQIQFLDEFENALAHFEGEAKKGICMLMDNFKKSLTSHGVREMKCIGQKYDPYMHEALIQQDSEKPEGTIISVVRKGYLFKDKILRHAQVIIAKKTEQKK